jgi:type I restriction-modification system DNA methylase subunit
MSELDVKTVNELIGVEESYQAPDQLMKILFKRGKREELFAKFVDLRLGFETDWFRDYFQQVQADRKEKKQDFTPQSIVNTLTRLVKPTENYFETAAGTGGILVTRWWQDCLQSLPWDYLPSSHFYQAEELSAAAIPFLLFNCAIRGMNAVVVNGDALSREVRQVYFIQNDRNRAFDFSSINVMPHSAEVTKEFEVKKWVEPERDYIESESLSELVQNAVNLIKVVR